MTEEERNKWCIEHEIMLLENQIKHMQDKITALKQQLKEMEQTEKD